MSIEFKKSGIVTSAQLVDSALSAMMSDLSSKYVFLEYLESTGTQWLDTGWLIPAAPWKTEVTYLYKQRDTTDRSVAGIRQLACKMVNHYSNYYESFVSIPTANYAANEEVTLCYWTTASTKNVSILTTSKGNYTGSSSYTQSAATDNNTLPLFGFRETGAASATWLFYGYINRYKIWENDTLIHYYVPAKRSSDSVLGMYDVITGTFLTNKGSGTFTAGPTLGTNSFICCADFIEN